ncbi:MAG: hypothetical protein HY713_01950 [candidate division NC10 bacterium]|nr:hypothetical protein [candidate division NC10 bacterium]
MTAEDRLNILAHDRFQEIIDEANRPNSPIRLQAVALDPDLLGQKTVTVVSQSQLASKLGLTPEQVTSSTTVAGTGEAPAFTSPDAQKVAQIAYAAIRRLENQPRTLPSVTYLRRPEIQRLPSSRRLPPSIGPPSSPWRQSLRRPTSRASWRGPPSWSCSRRSAFRAFWWSQRVR